MKLNTLLSNGNSLNIFNFNDVCDILTVLCVSREMRAVANDDAIDLSNALNALICNVNVVRGGANIYVKLEMPSQDSVYYPLGGGNPMFDGARGYSVVIPKQAVASYSLLDQHKSLDSLAKYMQESGDSVCQQVYGQLDYAWHCLVRTKNGRAFARGYNFGGKLGNGKGDEYFTNSFEELVINGMAESDTILQVEAADNHSMVLTRRGMLFVAGGNMHGQLGLGDNEDRELFTPVQIQSEDPDVRITQIYTALEVSVALMSDGSAWTCGNNDRYQAGHPKEDDLEMIKTFTKVDFESPVVNVACGYDATVFLLENGQIWACGQLRGCQFSPVEDQFSLTYRALQQVPMTDVMNNLGMGWSALGWIKKTKGIKVSVVSHQARVYVKINRPGILGSVYYPCEGGMPIFEPVRRNTFGIDVQRGVGVNLGEGTGIDSDQQQRLGGSMSFFNGIFFNGIKEISKGLQHTLVLTDDGRLYVTGKNQYGQLGLGDTTDRSKYALVEIQNKDRKSQIVSIGTGKHVSAVLMSDGSVWTCGNNECYQAGHKHEGGMKKIRTFTRVKLSGLAESVACGDEMTAFQLRDGSVRVSGKSGEVSAVLKVAPVYNLMSCLDLSWSPFGWKQKTGINQDYTFSCGDLSEEVINQLSFEEALMWFNNPVLSQDLDIHIIDLLQGDGLARLKKSYLTKAKQLHPDRPNGDGEKFCVMRNIFERIEYCLKMADERRNATGYYLQRNGLFGGAEGRFQESNDKEQVDLMSFNGYSP